MGLTKFLQNLFKGAATPNEPRTFREMMEVITGRSCAPFRGKDGACLLVPQDSREDEGLMALLFGMGMEEQKALSRENEYGLVKTYHPRVIVLGNKSMGEELIDFVRITIIPPRNTEGILGHMFDTSENVTMCKYEFAGKQGVSHEVLRAMVVSLKHIYQLARTTYEHRQPAGAYSQDQKI